LKIGHGQADDENVKLKNEMKLKHRDDKMLGGFESETKIDHEGKMSGEFTFDGPLRDIEGMEKSSMIAKFVCKSNEGKSET
jgi:hypothetical protein